MEMCLYTYAYFSVLFLFLYGGKKIQAFSFYYPETILNGVKSLIFEKRLGLNPLPKVSGCVTLEKLLTLSVSLKSQREDEDGMSSRFDASME